MYNTIARDYNQKNAASFKSTAWFYILLIIGFFIAILPADAAYATGEMKGAIDEVTSVVQGKLGQGAASLAVIAIGASAMMGKLSWPLAVTTMIGVVILFKASYIAGEFTP